MFCRPFPHGLLVGLAFASAADALAAAPTKADASAEQVYHVTRWTTEHGLPQTRVQRLAQTPDGYLWCGTWVGLARFDGVRFVVFDRLNTPAFREAEDIRGLAVDAQGRLCVATAQALVIRESAGSGFREITAEGRSIRGINNLWPAEDGGLWLVGGREILRLDSFFCITKLLPLPDLFQNANQIIIGSVGSIGVMLNSPEIHRLAWRSGQPGTWRELSGGRLPSRLFSGLVGCASNGVWAVRSGELRMIHRDGSEEITPLPEELARAGLALACVGRQQELWLIAGDGALWHWRDGAAQRVEVQPPTQLRHITAMLEDAEDNLWIGTDEGLLRLRPALARTFTTTDGLPHDSVRSVHPARNGGVWVATETGVAQIHDGKITSLPRLPWAKGAQFVAVCEDQPGTLVAATSHGGGLARWVDGGWKPWLPDIEDPAALYEDRQGRFWVGARYGAGCFDGATRR